MINHPTPWSIRSTNFGESIGYDSRSAIFDADGRHIVTIGTGSSSQVFVAELTASRIVAAVNPLNVEDSPLLEWAVSGAIAVSGWQPIETAPRNWSAVILFAPNYNDDWRQVFEGYYDPDRLSWYDRSDRPVSPTHWQPLPAPPLTAHTEAHSA